MRFARNKKDNIVLRLAITFTAVLYLSVNSTVSVKVFSLDEALSETNMSKPRIYIQNTGTVPLGNIKFYYYFTTENGKIPILENYYIPGFTVALKTVSTGNYKVEYTLNSTLNVGSIIPDNGGCVVGLHYNTWDAWNKTNDYSNNRLTTFTENPLIVVFQNGTKIYGTEPGSGGGTPTPEPDIPETDIRLNSFALYSTQQTTIRERSVFNGGGAVGSNLFVEVKNDAVIHGNVVSGANATLWHRVVIDGNIILGDSLTQAGMGNTFAGLQEGATVATLTLPDFSFTTNTNHITVNQSVTRDLPPGIYGDLNVLQNGVLKLSPGNYTFRKFYIENDAKVIFQINNCQQKIEISSSGEFALQDRAELKFATIAYAPSVQVYSRDQNELRIGVDVKTVGIITAPFATVNMYSGARCDGAIYAKNINIEPGVIFNSAMVDPNDDSDSDFVPDGIEILPCVNTDPTDPADYTPVAIPDRVVIDNTQNVVITYDLSKFYGMYASNSKMIMICPPGALEDPTVAPVVELSAELPAGTTALPAEMDCVPVGMYFRIKCNTINEGKRIFVGISTPGNSSTGNFDMAVHNPEDLSWSTFQHPYRFLTTLTIDERNLLTSNSDVIGVVEHTNTGTDDAGTLVAIWKNSNSAVAYYDDGTVFSTNSGSEIEVDMQLSGIIDPDTISPGKIIVRYTDLANPGIPIPPKELPFLLNGNKAVCLSAIDATDNGIRLDTVKIILKIADGSSDTILIRNPALEADREESFYIHALCNIADINKDRNFSISKIASTQFESSPFSADGLILKNGENYSYNYLLKDHLGSTRMVLAQDGSIKDALMYQPFGTVSNVDTITTGSTDPLRQKFTTNELDEDGASDYAIIGISTIVSGIVLNDTSSNVIILYYSDGTAHVFPLMNDTLNNTAYFEKILKFSSQKCIDSIKILTPGATPEVNYVSAVNYTVDVGKYGRVTLDTSANILVTYSSVNHFDKSPMAITSNIGQFYFGARSYDPGLGIWFTKDPAEVFFNSYAYTGNGSNPVNFVDPDGQFPVVALLGIAVGLLWLGHSLENYDAGMPPSYAFNPFKKYNGKMVWLDGCEEYLNQLSNSGAGVNIDGENSGFYYDVAGQRSYVGGDDKNSAEANADAIRNAYSKITVPAPEIDAGLQLVIDIGNINKNYYNMPPLLSFGKLPLTVGRDEETQPIFIPTKTDMGYASNSGQLSTALLGLASYGLEHFGESMITTSEVLFGGSMAAFGAAGITEFASGGTSTPFSLGAAAYGTGALSLSGYVGTAGFLSLGAAQFAKGENAKGAASLILSISGKPAEHIAELLGARPALQGLSGWLLEKYNESLVHH